MKHFYTSKQHPTPEERLSIWEGIQPHLPDSNLQNAAQQNKLSNAIMIQWPSFWMGQAAAIVLLLAGYGVYSLVQQSGFRQTDYVGNFDSTYSTSFQHIMEATPTLLNELPQNRRQAVESILQGIRELDEVIEELRLEIQQNGPTKAKLVQLRRMQAMKLDMLKEVILTEDISL